MTIRQRLLEIEGSTVAVREAGDVSQPAFVLLHGWPQSSRAFTRLMEELGVEFFVLAPDLPASLPSR